MSKVAIKGATTGTGTFTIESPATNTDRTLVLPDNAGTVLTSASDLAAANLTGNVAAARITDALNASGSAPIYACRAWVNFNGTGTVAIRASGNVSSITDNGTGDYTVNFTTAMPDANYSVNYNTDPNLSVLTNDVRAVNISNIATSSFRLHTFDAPSAATREDQEYIACSIFR
jgi:hypothetical protein